MRPTMIAPMVHKKGWGQEIWVCNNEEFCGKILEFKAGAKFSMHFHAKKREVFHVLEGELTLYLIDPATALASEWPLKAGDSVEIPRLQSHQLEARSDSRIIEFSTHHEDSDSYRVAPGDSQK